MSKRKISVLILVLLLVALVALTFASCSKKQMELTAFDNLKAVYNGEVQTIEVSCSIGDTSGWTVSYENEKGEVTSAPVNAGKYTATVTYSKKGYQTAKATATLVISKAASVVKKWPTVINNYPEIAPTERREVYGTPFSNDWLSVSVLDESNYSEYANVPGTFSWTSGQKLSGSTAAYDITFTPAGSSKDSDSYYNNYKTLKLSSVQGESKRPITVTPASPVLYGADSVEQNLNKPTYSVSGGSIKSGMPLSSIKLTRAKSSSSVTRHGYVVGVPSSTEEVSGTYRWGHLDVDGNPVYHDDPAASLTVHKAQTEYTYLFIPTNQVDLCIVQDTLDIIAEAGDVIIDTSVPLVASPISFGQKLSASVLSGGAAQNSLYGTFEWVDKDAIPDHVGTNSCRVIYYPKTQAGEEDPELNVKDDIFVNVTVNKAEIVFEGLTADPVLFGNTLEGVGISWEKAYILYGDEQRLITDEDLAVEWSASDLPVNDSNFTATENKINSYNCPINLILSEAVAEYVSDQAADIVVTVVKKSVQLVTRELDYGEIGNVTFGTPLSSVTLPTDQTFRMRAEDTLTYLSGTFAWVDATIYPGAPDNAENVRKEYNGTYYKAIFTPSDATYESKFVYFRVGVQAASGSEAVGLSMLPSVEGVVAGTPLSEVTLVTDDEVSGIKVKTYVYNYFTGYKEVAVQSLTELLQSAHYMKNAEGEFVKATQFIAGTTYYVREYIEIPGTIAWDNPNLVTTTANSLYDIRFTPATEYVDLVESFTRKITLIVYTDSSCFDFDVVNGNAVITGIKEAHSGCGGHENLIINETIKDARGMFTVVGIGEGAFKGNVEIKKVELPETVANIQEEAFAGCTSLTEINFPVGLKEVGKKAFEGCNALETITFSASNYLEKIGDFAFKDCVKLTVITVPDTIDDIGIGAFANCVSLTDVTIAANAKYRLTDDKHAILKSDTEGVFNILHTYFASNASLSYAIDDAVETIAAYAFAYNSTLSGKVIARKVKVIEEYAFAYSPSLTYVYFMEDVDVYEISGETFDTLFADNDHVVVYGPEGSVNLKTYCENANITFKEQTTVRYLGLVQINNTSYKTTVDVNGEVTICGIAEGEFLEATGLTEENFEKGKYSDKEDLTFYYPDLASNSYVAATVFEPGKTYYYYSIFDEEIFDPNAEMELIIPAYIDKEYFEEVREISGDKAKVVAVTGFAGTNITKLVLPDTVTVIGDRAFEHCTKLTEVVLSANLTTIGKNAFNECSKLTNIVIPASVTSIKSNAFTECTALATATFEADVATLGENIFYHAPVEIYGPESGTVRDYCYGRYSYNAGTRVTCLDYRRNDAGTGIVIYGLKSHNCPYGHADIVIPEKIEGLPVVEIRDEAFKGNLEIVSISIPATVKKIGSGVFNGCDNLKSASSGTNPYFRLVTNEISGVMQSIVIYSGSGDTLISYFAASPAKTFEVPESVTKIGAGSFAGAKALDSIKIGANVSSIAADAFNGCTCSISISDSNRYFSTDSVAIYNKSGTTLITYLTYNERDIYYVDSSVQVIGERAFYGNTSLQRIVIGNGVKVIEADAFNGANRLVSVTVQGGLTSIGNNAFAGATSLASFYVEDDVAALGRDVFSGDSALVIYSPNGENLGLYAYNNELRFNNCYSATSFLTEGNSEEVTVTGLTNAVRYDNENKEKKLNISIPPYINGARVRKIGVEAFNETSIGRGARLNSIYIPDTVLYIESGAFRDCTSLSSVYFGGNMDLANISESAFDGILMNKLYFYFDEAAIYLYTQFINSDRGYINVLMSSDTDCLEYNDGTAELTKVVVGQSQHICSKSHNFVNVPAKYEETTVVDETPVVTKYDVVSVKDGAFSGNNKIYTVTFEDNNAENASLMIGNKAFEDAKGLTEVNFASHTTSIGNYAFHNAVKLTTLVLPENLQSIGQYAFAGCTSLTAIFFTNDVETLGTAVFGLEGDRNPELVVYGPAIGELANYCATYGIKYQTTELAYNAWTGESYFDEVVFDDETMTCSINKFAPYSNLDTVVIPYVISSHKVVKIGDNCFNGGSSGADGYSDIKQVIIGEGVEEIGKFAFANMSGLTSITIPASVKKIGSRAFVSCNNLTEIYFKGDINTEGMQNLVSTTNKISVFGPADSNIETYFSRFPLASYNAYTMPSCFLTEDVDDKTLYISGLKDHYCKSGHTNIDIPEYINGKKVVGIRTHAFEEHTDIYSLSIPATIVDIETAAFYGCTGLKVVKVAQDNPAYKYADGALLSMDGKKMYICLSGDVAYTVPDGVTEIVEGAFDGAVNMELLNLNEQVAKIAPDAFKGCDMLQRIAVPEQNPNFIFTAGALFNKGQTLLYIYLYTNYAESYDVPASVTSVADYAFRKAGKLKQIRFASDVTVGEEIFGKKDDIHAVVYAPAGSYNVEKAAIYAGLEYYNDITPCLAYEEDSNGNIKIIGFSCIDHVHDEINIPLYIDQKPVVTIGAGAFAEDTFNDGYLEVALNPEDFVKGKYYEQVVNYQAYEPATAYDENEEYYEKVGERTYNHVSVNSEIDFLSGNYYVFVVYDILYVPADSYSDGTLYYLPVRGVRIGDNVTRIESGAFRGSNLRSVVIGANVESIAYDAFTQADALQEVFFKADLTPEVGAFSGLNDLTVYFTEDCTGLDVYFTALFEDQIGNINYLTDLNDSQYCFEYEFVALTAIITGVKNHLCLHNHNDLNVPSFVLNRYTVTAIADNAFENNQEIIRLTLPNSVATLGSGALSGCIRLTDIVLENNNPYFAFKDGVLFGKEGEDLTKLIFYTAKNTATSYMIPDGITEVAVGAFYGNGYLKNVTIGKDVTVVGDRVFVACLSLQNIYVHEENTAFVSTAKYGDAAVGVLYAIKSKLPNGNVDEAALVAYPAGAKSTYVTVGGSFDVNEVRSGAFDSAKYLTMIYFETYVSIFGEEGIFDNLANLASLKVCMPIGAAADSFASYVSGLDITVLRYTSKDCLTFERNTSGYTVTGIKAHAEEGACPSGNHLTIAVPLYYNGVVVNEIGDYAFAGSDAEKVSVTGTIGVIGVGAFADMDALTEIELVASPINGSSSAYYFENGVLYTNNKKDVLHTYLASNPYATVTFGDVLLIEVEAPATDGNEEETPANEEEDANEEPAAPSVTYTENNDTQINGTESIMLRGVKKVLTGAFNGNDFVKEIGINAGLTEIGDGAFSLMTSLVDIVVSNANEHYVFDKSIGALFNRDRSLLHTYLYSNKADSVILQNVNITSANGLTHIGARAFEGTKASRVRLPDSIVYVGDYAFKDMQNLKYLYFESSPETEALGINIMGDMDEITIGRKILVYGPGGEDRASTIDEYRYSTVQNYFIDNYYEKDDVTTRVRYIAWTEDDAFNYDLKVLSEGKGIATITSMKADLAYDYGYGYKEIVVAPYVKIDGVKYNIAKIGENAFKDRVEIKALTLLYSVEEIEEGFVKGAYNIEDIFINDNDNYIVLQNDATYACGIVYSSDMTTLMAYMPMNAPRIVGASYTDFSVPQSVTRIAAGA